MAHSSNNEKCNNPLLSAPFPETSTIHSVNRTERIGCTKTPNSTDDGNQINSPPPETNAAINAVTSSSLTAPRNHIRFLDFFTSNSGSANKSPLPQSSLPIQDAAPTPQISHIPQQPVSLTSNISNDNLIPAIKFHDNLDESTKIPCVQLSDASGYSSEAPAQSSQLNNTCGNDLPKPPSIAIGIPSPEVGVRRSQSSTSHWSLHSRLIQSVSSSSEQHSRAGIAAASQPDIFSRRSHATSWHEPVDEGRYLNSSKVTPILPYSHPYAPSTRSTVLVTQPIEEGYVATNPFRAHSRNNAGQDNQISTDRLTFDDIPTSTKLYSARTSASISAHSLSFAPISTSQSYLPEHPHGGYPLHFLPNKQFVYSAQPDLGPELNSKSSIPPPSFLQPRKSLECSSSSAYTPEPSTEHKEGRDQLLGEKVEPSQPNDTVAVDQGGYDHSSDNYNIPDAPFKAPLLLPMHNSCSLSSAKTIVKLREFCSRINGRFRRLSPLGLKVQQKVRECASFAGRTLLQQLYLHFLLRLPLLYFTRVARIFEEADLTLSEIKGMALETALQGSATLNNFSALTLEARSAAVPPQYERLKTTWESFIDSVMREWKTFNIISALLLSAIVTILQISGAADDPITRYSALLSLICALLSLLFGGTYIIRFGNMRQAYKAAEWALEAKRTKTAILWNVWVLLAMPVFWLTWSIVLYIACIMSFIWRTNAGSTQPPPALSDTTLLLIRVFMSAVLGLGFIYSALVLKTFSRYGEAMDKAWKRRINGWVQEKILRGPASTHRTHSYTAPSGQYPHLPEPYTHSIPSRASNEGDHLSTLHASLSITRHDQDSASILRRNVSRASRINPPMYVPGPGDSKHEDEPLPSKRHRHQVAVDNPTHKTDFRVLSRPEKQPTVESAFRSADIQQNSAPEASDDYRAESEYEMYASGPSSPVDRGVDAL